MKFNNKQNEKIESTDGRTFWISRSVAVVSTIVGFLNSDFSKKNGHILAVKRGPKVDNTGKYCLPCGYLDWDEDGATGAKREIWEETGLDVDALLKDSKKKIAFFKNPWKTVTDPALDDKQNICLYYGAIFDWSELPELSSENCEEGEVDALEWISFDKLDSVEWAFHHKQRILDFCQHIMEVNL